MVHGPETYLHPFTYLLTVPLSLARATCPFILAQKFCVGEKLPWPIYDVVSCPNRKLRTTAKRLKESLPKIVLPVRKKYTRNTEEKSKTTRRLIRDLETWYRDYLVISLPKSLRSFLIIFIRIRYPGCLRERRKSFSIKSIYLCAWAFSSGRSFDARDRWQSMLWKSLHVVRICEMNSGLISW